MYSLQIVQVNLAGTVHTRYQFRVEEVGRKFIRGTLYAHVFLAPRPPVYPRFV